MVLKSNQFTTRDGGLEDRPRSRGRPRDLILMASVSVLVLAAHVSVSVLASEVPASTTTLGNEMNDNTYAEWEKLETYRGQHHHPLSRIDL